MISTKVAERRINHDVGRTGRIYKMAPKGSSWACRCSGCRNFDQIRPNGYPIEFKLLLKSLGINPKKEAHLKYIVPAGEGEALYAGTYGFIGEMPEAKELPPVIAGQDVFEPLGGRVWVSIRPWREPPGVWYGKPTLRLEFLMVLPWLLDEEQLEVREMRCAG
ncbi:MAG: hypothetical protein C0608_05320 [Deltaproteobacteria bacterium]|nr:MAG: hypothetical protein C0608_05320 [Deltaproteobacteria bacterium]